jgi:polyhydroxybutyrate depolymerase
MRTLLILLTLFSFSCAGSPNREVGRFQGRERSWLLHLPPGEAAGQPLVLALHGGGGTAEGLDALAEGALTREAARRGYVLVFPEGVDKGWNDGRPPGNARDQRRQAVDDVAFLDGLIDHLVQAHALDRTRVFLTGMSNGGFMVQRFALDRAFKVAAIAPVVATVAQAWAHLRPARPVPALYILGTHDPLVPYGGGTMEVFGARRGVVRSGPDSAAHWASLNGCSHPPTREVVPDRAPHDDTRAVVDRFACAAPVELWTLQRGGHTWPRGKQYLPRIMVGVVSEEVDTALIFDFFARMGEQRRLESR